MCSTCKGRGRYDVDDYTLEAVDSTITPWAELLQRFVNCRRAAAGAGSPPTRTRGRRREHPICDDCNGTGRVPAPFTGVVRADLGSSARTARRRNPRRARPRPRAPRRARRSTATSSRPARTCRHRPVRALPRRVGVGAGRADTAVAPRRGRCGSSTGRGRRSRPSCRTRFEKRLPGEIRAQYDHRQASLEDHGRRGRAPTSSRTGGSSWLRDRRCARSTSSAAASAVASRTSCSRAAE
jgi:hypothetical protein